MLTILAALGATSAAAAAIVLLALCLGEAVLLAVLLVKRPVRRPVGARLGPDGPRHLRNLTGWLIEAQEAERRRIARELHDDLNQSLALLAVELDLLAAVPPEPGAELTQRMHELSNRVKQLSTAVHDLSHRLHPAKLEQLGLVAAVRSLCGELSEAHDLVIDFIGDDVPSPIGPDVALCLYRIAQESLRNVVKHSGGRQARVELYGTPNAISLTIVDDGAGFDPAEVVRKGGLGLVSMQERLRLVGGEITLDSRLGCGTCVRVRVPVEVNRPVRAQNRSRRQPVEVSSMN